MFRQVALRTIVAAGLSASFAVAADEVKPDTNKSSTPFAINFKGFCDYFLITQRGRVLAGDHIVSVCGPLADGLVSGNFNMAEGVAPFGTIMNHSWNLNSTVSWPRGLFYLFDLDAGTWANYRWDGTTLTMVNQGTFTKGPPPPAGVIAKGRLTTENE